MRRRAFLNAVACAGVVSMGETLLPALAHGGAARPIVDTHIHLFDPTRPGGIPWPAPSDTVLYRPSLPARYKDVTRGLGVVGAIAIEASPRPEDNDWVLSVLEREPLMVGLVGDLVPHDPTFLPELRRLRQNPLFLGIRYGNLWDRDLTMDIGKPGFADGVRALEDARLVFESANPTPALVATLRELAEAHPGLTVVIDHLPHMALPLGDELPPLIEDLRRLAAQPRVFIKLSEIPKDQDRNVEAYRKTLDLLWSTFGEDRVLFGSDWPNSDHVLPYRDTLKLLQEYAFQKTRRAQEKLFWRNSIAAYRWKPRTAAQRRLTASL